MCGFFILEWIILGNGNVWIQYDNVFIIDCVIFVLMLFICFICVDLVYFFKFLLKNFICLIFKVLFREGDGVYFEGCWFKFVEFVC